MLSAVSFSKRRCRSHDSSSRVASNRDLHSAKGIRNNRYYRDVKCAEKISDTLSMARLGAPLIFPNISGRLYSTSFRLAVTSCKDLSEVLLFLAERKSAPKMEHSVGYMAHAEKERGLNGTERCFTMAGASFCFCII